MIYLCKICGYQFPLTCMTLSNQCKFCHEKNKEIISHKPKEKAMDKKPVRQLQFTVSLNHADVGVSFIREFEVSTNIESVTQRHVKQIYKEGVSVQAVGVIRYYPPHIISHIDVKEIT